MLVTQNAPFFYDRKKDVLLCTTEALDLIYKQDRALTQELQSVR